MKQFFRPAEDHADLEAENQKLKAQLKQFSNTDRINRELNSKMLLLNEENQNLKTKLLSMKQLNELNSQQQALSKSVMSKSKYSDDQVDQLLKLLRQKTSQCEQLESDLNSALDKMVENDDEINRLNDENKTLQSRLTED